MKTYIITEKDIDQIRFGSTIGDDITIDDVLDNLNELPVSEKYNFEIEIPDDFYTNRTKYFVNIELDDQRTEFKKFIEDNNFTKPEQPYYEKDGYIVDYGEMRDLFLEFSRKKS